eukprot:3577017-Heterocapsa_arctica.AAC.1
MATSSADQDQPGVPPSTRTDQPLTATSPAGQFYQLGLDQHLVDLARSSADLGAPSDQLLPDTSP